MNEVITTLKSQGANAELCSVVATILEATVNIDALVTQGGLANVHGLADNTNVQGEQQKKLDVIANDLFKARVLASGKVRTLASEEEDTVIAGKDGAPFIVAFDPLDGSSNIDINAQIGTIFTIYAAREQVPPDCEQQFAQAGHKQLCAGYVLYSTATVLAITTTKVTQFYTLDRNKGVFVLTLANSIVPKQTNEFSVNMANMNYWSEGFKAYISELLKAEHGAKQPCFTMRWNGAMVGDIHRVLTRGGIFCYPYVIENKIKKAKLRLLYEANPMALLIENAGGAAYTESERILDLTPQQLHQRVPVIMGSKSEVKTCLSYLG